MLLMKSEEGYLLQTYVNAITKHFFNQNSELNKAKTIYVKVKIKFFYVKIEMALVMSYNSTTFV